MKSGKFLISFFIIMILPLAAQRPARAQAPDVKFFPETGHTVRGLFLSYYHAAQDPLLVFGYPITEQMISRDGKTVQYFQRVRFEQSIDSLGMPHIQLTAIGSALYKPGKQHVINNPQACQFFSSTGYSVCFQFLDFYRAQGGPERFGNPLSPFEVHNDVLVQYFEFARFEWRADGFRGRVVPTDLGRIYFDVLGEDPVQLHPVEPLNAAINPVLAVKVQAWVAKPIVKTSGDQTIFIIARSQTNQPLANAAGMATVRLPDGSLQTHPFATDSRGLAQVSLIFNNQPVGEVVQIEITVAYQNLKGATKTSFRIWY